MENLWQHQMDLKMEVLIMTKASTFAMFTTTLLIDTRFKSASARVLLVKFSNATIIKSKRLSLLKYYATKSVSTNKA